MSNLPVLSGVAEPSYGRGWWRQAAKEIVRSKARSSVISASGVAGVEAIAEVTEAALMATSHVSAVEAMLVRVTPHAEARLRHIADAGCIGMANVVMSTRNRI
jgi:hypothetical protein